MNGESVVMHVLSNLLPVTEVSKTLLQYDGVLIKVYFLLFHMFEFVLTKRFVSFRFPPCLLKYNSCTVKRPVLSAVLSFSSHICLCNPYPITIQNTAITPQISVSCIHVNPFHLPPHSTGSHCSDLFIYFFATDGINMDLFVPGFFYSTECYWDPSLCRVYQKWFSFLKFFIDEVFLCMEGFIVLSHSPIDGHLSWF